MDDKQLYDILHSFICDNKCNLNTWYEFKYINTEKGINIHCEVMYPSRGNMRVRIPNKAMNKNDEGETVYRYSLYRFSNKREFINDGIGYGVRSDVKLLA